MENGDRFDLTGRTFGKLTALRCVEGQRSRGVWECACECGKVKRASYHSLTQGLTASCGCTRARAGIKDLTGQRFGRLVAEERTSGKKGTSYIWRCRCDCGGEALVSANSLLKGDTASCGCLRQERRRAAFTDLTGQRFGRLVAVAPLERRSGGSVVWQCRCDCGRESQHAAKALTSGRAKSCGCLAQENDAPRRALHYVDGTCVEFIENMGDVRRDNTSGYRGLKAVRGKWQVRITFKKKTYYLGTYDDRDEAIRIRKKAEQLVYGEFIDWYNAQFPDRPTIKHRKKTAAENQRDSAAD